MKAASPAPSTLRRQRGLLASQRRRTKPRESGPCLSLPLVAEGRESNAAATERNMHVPGEARRHERSVPPCASEWNAWLDEDLRQARAYAAYGASEREAA